MKLPDFLSRHLPTLLGCFVAAVCVTALEHLGSNQTAEAARKPDPDRLLIDAHSFFSQTGSFFVIDLDGDGVETLGLDAGIYFDFDNNQFKELTSWPSSDDALLVIDRDGNGKITEGSELLNAGIESLDTNFNGRLEAADSSFKRLRVFHDKNQNALTDPGELISLADAGIAELSLDFKNNPVEQPHLDVKMQTGHYTTRSNAELALAQVWPKRNLTQTQSQLQLEVPKRIKRLPNVEGSGTTYSLHQAMAQDESGRLESLVIDFYLSTSHQERLSLVEKIVFFWTGQREAEQTHELLEIDARKVNAIESLYGFELPKPEPRHQKPTTAQDQIKYEQTKAKYVNQYNTVFQNWLDKVFFKLSAQSHLEPIFTDIHWVLNQDTGVMEGNFNKLPPRLLHLVKLEPHEAEGFIQDLAVAVRGTDPHYQTNVKRLGEAISSYMNQNDLSSYPPESVALLSRLVKYDTSPTGEHM